MNMIAAVKEVGILAEVSPLPLQLLLHGSMYRHESDTLPFKNGRSRSDKKEGGILRSIGRWMQLRFLCFGQARRMVVLVTSWWLVDRGIEGETRKGSHHGCERVWARLIFPKVFSWPYYYMRASL